MEALKHFWYLKKARKNFTETHPDSDQGLLLCLKRKKISLPRTQGRSIRNISCSQASQHINIHTRVHVKLSLMCICMLKHIYQRKPSHTNVCTKHAQAKARFNTHLSTKTHAQTEASLPSTQGTYEHMHIHTYPVTH
jgi:hypothetical protein